MLQVNVRLLKLILRGRVQAAGELKISMEAYAHISQKVLIGVTLELLNGFQFPHDTADLVDYSLLSKTPWFQLFCSPLGS